MILRRLSPLRSLQISGLPAQPSVQSLVWHQRAAQRDAEERVDGAFDEFLEEPGHSVCGRGLSVELEVQGSSQLKNMW